MTNKGKVINIRMNEEDEYYLAEKKKETGIRETSKLVKHLIRETNVEGMTMAQKCKINGLLQRITIRSGGDYQIAEDIREIYHVLKGEI